MKQILSDLLIYPFDNNLIEALDTNADTLFINCLPVPSLNEGDVLNFYANDEKKWRNGSHKIISGLEDNFYDQIFCTLPKNKIEVRYFISLITKHLNKNGRIIISAANDLGGKNLPKWMNEFGFIGENFSKKKSRVFVGKLEKPDNDMIQECFEAGSMHELTLDGIEFLTQSGVFGWDKVDRGSKLLVETIDKSLSGVGADFGCGYGYLSYQILSKYKDIKKLYAIDVDSRAISCARKNLKHFDTEVSYHWADLTKPFPFKEKLHWIVMNPPFHEGKERKDNLGQAMIESAYQALGNTGVLYMVANRHLPYEKTLSMFSSVEKLKEEDGFKVYRAVK